MHFKASTNASELHFLEMAFCKLGTSVNSFFVKRHDHNKPTLIAGRSWCLTPMLCMGVEDALA